MYRVELKVSNASANLIMQSLSVPNVPCGVERREGKHHGDATHPKVPNVPCGVESRNRKRFLRRNNLFLMYRVELKVNVCKLYKRPFARSS